MDFSASAILFCFSRNIGVSGKKTKMTSKRSDKAIAHIGYEIYVEYAPNAKLITTPMWPLKTNVPHNAPRILSSAISTK